MPVLPSVRGPQMAELGDQQLEEQQLTGSERVEELNPELAQGLVSRRNRRRGILITGGGTAGHTNPGIAVAQSLVALGLHSDQVHFVGGARGSEGSLVPDAGFSIDLLPGRGIVRSMRPAKIVQNIVSVAGLIGALFKALALMVRRRPGVVLCLGGYASFAASAAAVILRVPLVVSEQNARASVANLVFGRFARACAVPFPETDLPKAVLTGNPIRPSIVEAVESADPARSRQMLLDRVVDTDGGPPITDAGDRVFVAVWAGSLGARRINDAIVELAQLWKQRGDVVLYHIVGRRDWETHGGTRPDNNGGLHYLRVAYEANMPELLATSDVAVCRSGASTVTELAVAGLPSILVPLPYAPRDHQRANTGELVTAGGATVLADADVNAAAIDELLGPLVADASRRQTMSDAARSVARPNAASAVAKLLIDVGGFEPATTGEAMPTTKDRS